jgi:hypothetical protein
MRKIFFALAIAAAFVTSPAFAQEGVGPDAGDYELQLGAGGSNDNDFSGSTFNADATLGYYLDRNWELTLRQGINYNDVGVAGSNLDGSTRVGVAYNFDMGGSVRPFLGGDIGYRYGDTTDDTWVAAASGGLKWYVKPETFIFARADYEWLFDETNQATNNFDDGIFLYTAGVGFNF